MTSKTDRYRTHAWLPGEVLAGKYELIEQVGAGGMGVVHAARRLSLGDVVAIKSILPDRTNPRNRARFLREARAVARIRHPNVVQVFDFGEAEDGRPYMVMEFVDGPTLAAVLAAGRVPLDQALPLFADVCKAVEAGHRRGVVHRDLKPGNVMLDLSDDGTQTVKVLDFGLARVADDDDHERSRAGALVGTCAYMSPESIEQGAASPASDVFALGVMLYEIVTGALPFRGANAIATIMAICEGVYPPAHELVPELPSALAQAITAALERSPSARPGSAMALAAMALGREPVISQLVSSGARGRRHERPLDPAAAGPAVEKRGDTLTDEGLATEQVELPERSSDTHAGLESWPGSGSGRPQLPSPQSVYSRTGESVWTSHTGVVDRQADTLDGDDPNLPDPDSLWDSQDSQRDSQRVRAALGSPPFVGRKLELDTLLELHTAAAPDEVPIALLLGANGMGRTRSLRHFGELARARGAAVFEGRFWGYEDEPATADETYARMLGGDEVALGVDQRSGFASLAKRFEAGANGRTVVLLLDDLQQAPSRDLEFLTYLARGERRAVPFVVVGSARTQAARSDAQTELSRWLLALAGHKARTTLTLSRLHDDELRSWLEAVFGRLRIRPRDFRRLAHASAGNPYFLSELVRHLVASERIHQSEGEDAWVCDRLARDMLPEGVSSMIAAQLASLDAPLRQMLETAAVIGEQLRFDVLAQAMGLDEDTLEQLVEAAMDRDLLAEEDPESGVDLRFRSSTVQAVLYYKLTNRRRRRLHKAVVTALVDFDKTGTDERAAKLFAWHYRAIADWPRTLAWGLRAAREGLGRHDHDAAEHALEHAQVALDKLGDGAGVLDQLRFAALFGSLDARAGRYAEGVTRLRGARGLLEHHADQLEAATTTTSSSAQVGPVRSLPHLRFEIALSLARCHLGLGELDKAAELGTESLALATAQVGDEHQRLEAEWEARVALGHTLGRFGSWAKAIDVLTPIVELAPPPQLRALHALALRERGWLAARSGAIQDAERYTAQVQAQAKASGEPLTVYCAASVTAVTHAARGESRLAVRSYREALRGARSLSLRRRELIEQANLALSLVGLGEFDEALQQMLCVRAICRELGDVASSADARVGLGRVLRGRGDLDQAIDSFRRGHEACEAVGRHEYAAIALFELGGCELERGRWAAAREVLLDARERFASLASVHQWEVELALARAARGLNEQSEALALAGAARVLLEGRRSSAVASTLRDAVDRGLSEVDAFVQGLG